MEKLKFESKEHAEMYKELMRLYKEDLTKSLKKLNTVEYTPVDPETSGYEWLLYSFLAFVTVAGLYQGVKSLVLSPTELSRLFGVN